MSLIIRRLEQASTLLAIVSICIIMVVVSFDAILRYAFNSPLQWASDLVRFFLMVGGIYFALSSTFTHGDHVNINIFRNLIWAPLLVWLDVAWCLMAAVVFALITYVTWQNVATAYASQEVIQGYILWPSWLSFLPIPVGSLLILIRLVHHCVRLATQGHDDDVLTDGEPLE